MKKMQEETTMNRWTLGIAILLSLAALSATSFKAIDAPAASITVCASGCDYSTIQAAVDASGYGDTIDVAAETFVENPYIIDKQLTIQGAGQGLTIVDGGGLDSVFSVYGGQVTLADITVRNGWAYAGGGILSSDGTSLLVTNCEIRDNHATDAGGGIVNFDGTLVITSNTITENRSYWRGGGFFSAGGQTTIEASTISHNRAFEDGGGVVAHRGNVVISKTLITRNSAQTSAGGGIFASGASSGQTNLLVQYSSIVSNGAMYYGGGLFVYGFNGADESFTLKNSTVSDNGAWQGGGGWVGKGLISDSTIVENRGAERCGGLCGRETTLLRTIVANNTLNDCDAIDLVQGGFNISSDDSCGFSGDTDLENTDPLLTPLDYYGGLTPTHGLDPASPALDRAPSCSNFDQRGVARPQDGDSDGELLCDIGAFELESAVLIVGVDIMPRQEPNVIDLQSRRFIRVAVLGSDSFDVSAIDPSTLRFGPKGAAAFQQAGSGPFQKSYPQDINGDGYDDLIAGFLIQDTGIACGDETATLTGGTYAGEEFQGYDWIETVKCVTEGVRPDRVSGHTSSFGARHAP